MILCKSIRTGWEEITEKAKAYAINQEISFLAKIYSVYA